MTAKPADPANSVFATSRRAARGVENLPPTARPISRRQLLERIGLGLGSLALVDLCGPAQARATSGVLTQPHHPPRAKRVIYLFQSGGPSQLETFDYKPILNQMQGQPLPDSVRQGQRLTGMSANQAVLPLAGSKFQFSQHGQAGTWVSELLPHTAQVADRLAVVRSMVTEAINHDPAITLLQTGQQIAGRPSIGAWATYGLGSDNENLPAFVVLITKGKADQPLYARLWGTGFLPSRYQGVQFRSGKDPVLYLNNPPGISPAARRAMLDRLRELHQLELAETGDLEIENRIAQYEMAFRMQTSVPEVTDISAEPQHVLDLYGPDVTKPGTFAANCLLARRLAERQVKFIQLYHQGWDQHGSLPRGISTQCRETDQPAAALLRDLEQRGLLDETLVVWGGEFGRTNYSQGKLTADDYGRDHHPRCFSIWLAGGGIRPGTAYGETCPFGYNVVSGAMHVRDLHATLLHLLGIDHERLTYPYQGLDARLTGVEPARVVTEILA